MRIEGQRVVMPCRGRVELEPYEYDMDTLAPDEVCGDTVATLISPGTEIAVYKGNLNTTFPIYPGYAAIFRVRRAGNDVRELREGDLVFCLAPHQSTITIKAAEVLPLLPGIDPQTALFARLAGISMTTLNTAASHPPQLVLVNGLGIVGNIAAQMFNTCGYEVVARDPDEKRCSLARGKGILRTFNEFPMDDPSITGRVSLVLECRCNERDVLLSCGIVAPRGEIVLVGVPWEKREDVSAFALLHAVFHKYAVIRSGWEWETPVHEEKPGGYSIHGNYRAAMEWLGDRRISVEGLYETADPLDIGAIYRNILERKSKHLTYLLDWSAAEHRNA